MSRFDAVPTISRPRTRFNLSFDNKTSSSVGRLTPMYYQEIYPGDSFRTLAKFVARTTSAYLRPVMDVVNCDVYFFFVPSRLVFDDWGKVFGESANAWAQQSETEVPHTKLGYQSNGDIVEGSVMDCFGAPICTGVPDGISLLIPRMFALVYDEYFRDQNFIAPMLIQKGQQNPLTEIFNNNPWSPSNYTGMCPPVAKYHDYFTSCLPSPQKSTQPVIIPLGAGGNIPVYPMGFPGQSAPTSQADFPGLVPPTYLRMDGLGQLNTFTSANGGSINVANGTVGDNQRRQYFGSASTGSPSYSVFMNNLYARGEDFGPDVSDFRTAVQLQKMLERDARGGTRYTEYIASTFGVRSPDARLQRPEFLGGARIPLNIQQVAQTTEGSSTSSLGDLGAYSWTNGICRFSKAFTEHGYIIGCFALRYKHNYSQGWERCWLKTKRFDFMDPVFSHLSEQPVYKSEIYGNIGAGDVKGDVFGYNEIYADLRFRQSKITCAMRSSAVASQDIWHFGDVYANAPSLNASFINETPQFVDRTLAVPSTSQDQFIFDWYFKQDAVRELPMYGTPGLVDHN